MLSSPSTLIEERLASGGVLTLELRNGRVNTLTRPFRTQLIDALDRAEHDSAVRVVVLRGDGVFSAGADLHEFDSGEGLAEPSLHGTINTFLDGMSTPVVAVIEGVALGGGLELALASHYRIAAADSIVGLPEIGFAFIPGAGGTQRLPRAVGVERALVMMLEGARVAATELADTDLIDELVADVRDLDAAVSAFAERIADASPRRLRDVMLDADRTQALLDIAARGANTQWTASLVEAVRAGVVDFDHGVAEEQRLFAQLADTDTAAARRHLFLAERAARRTPGGTVGTEGLPRMERVSVIGGGTMGRGIAIAHALAGITVDVIEVDDAAASMTTAALANDIERAARRSPLSAESIRARLSVGADRDVLAEADLVIEAVPEVFELKSTVLAGAFQRMRDGAVLATNTSSLDVDALAQKLPAPDSLVGMHFFAPAYVMRLVEVVRGAATSDRVLATTMRHASRLGKVPVVSGVGPGFIGNRILEAANREVGHLLLEGAAVDEIDGALEGWGMRMGPLRVLDLVGNDVPMLVREAQGTADAIEWSPTRALIQHGWLGVKSGRGWYRYDGGRAQVDPKVESLLASLRAQNGADGSGVPTRETIVDRVVLALVNESAAVVREGIAARGGDIDVVFAEGYGFPADRGGPMHYADRRGLANVVRVMERFARQLGAERWTPDPLLRERAAAGRTLTSGEAA